MAGKKAKPKNAFKITNFENLKSNEVLCPICRTILIEPVTLPCDHVFCKLCFEGTMEKANLVCPLCRLRVGSWFRKAKKENTVVNEKLWKAIQEQYPVEIENKHQGIDNDIEEDKPVIVVANPGEIREEYEKERQRDLEEQRRNREAEEIASDALIKKIKDEEDYKKQVEEEKLRLDALLAKKLAEELSAPASSKSILRKPMKTESAKKFGPMDRFIKTQDSVPNRRFSHKKLDLNKTYPTKSIKKPLSTSPNSHLKPYLGKEYTCHVLPVEQSPIRVNRTNNLFADLDFKGIFGALGQKPTKTTEPDRRKSICTSGYKSCGSDVIDQECKFYFKPIDTQRRYHVPAKVPLKVPSVFGVNEGNVPIEPPTGKIVDLGNVMSAFARFTEDPEPEQNEIESETSFTPEAPVKNLKRKIATKNLDIPARKKGKRHVFGMKENLLKKLETTSVTSPFYGFDVKPERIVNDSPFYGFNTLHIEESERERDAVSRLISIYDANIMSKEIPRKKYTTYNRHRNKIKEIPKKVGLCKHISAKVGSSSLPNKDSDIDINKNISKSGANHSQRGLGRLNNIRISLNANSRIAKILNTALQGTGAVDMNLDPKQLDSNSENLVGDIKTEPDPGLGNTCSKAVDSNAKNSPLSAASREENSVEVSLGTASPIIDTSRIQRASSVSGEISSIAISSYGSVNQNRPVSQYATVSEINKKLLINGDVKNRATSTPVSSPSVIKNSDLLTKPEPECATPMNKLELSMGTPPGIFDSDSDDDGLSKLIDTICNPTELKDSAPTTPVIAPITLENSPSKKGKGSPRKSTTKRSPKKIPIAERLDTTVNSDYKAVNNVGKDNKSYRISKNIKILPVNDILPKTRNCGVETNSKITDSFSKAKSSPPKSRYTQGRVRSSPRKATTSSKLRPDIESLHMNGNVDIEQKKLQEESDFELAKKLQAEFDMIQVSSRTRRGTKRQITLDEMLSV